MLLNDTNEVAKIIHEYLKQNGIETFNEWDENYIYAQTDGGRRIGVININGYQLHMKCRSFDLHDPNSLQELMLTLKACLKQDVCTGHCVT